MGKYVGLWVFGLAFGYVEAAVVIYLRHVFDIGSGSLFPLADAFGERNSLLMAIELRREAVTLVLMLVPALFVSRRTVYRLLAYLLVFAVWDLSYYAFLRLHLGWPDSLFTYDILFMIPTLWVAPVLCPVLISGSVVLYASGLMALAQQRSMVSPSLVHGALLLVAVALVLFAFTGSANYFLQGGLPPRFSWLPFTGGYLIATGAALHYLYQVTRKPRMRFI